MSEVKKKKKSKKLIITIQTLLQLKTGKELRNTHAPRSVNRQNNLCAKVLEFNLN